MTKYVCPVCRCAEVNTNGYCTGCGFDVWKYSTLSEHEQEIMLYKHAHPEGVVESRLAVNGKKSSLTHAGQPIRKCSACGEIYLEVHSDCPKCHAPNPSKRKMGDAGGGKMTRESQIAESDVVKTIEKTNEILSGIQTKLANKECVSWFSVFSAVFVAVLLWSTVEGCFNMIKENLTPSPAYRY